MPIPGPSALAAGSGIGRRSGAVRRACTIATATATTTTATPMRPAQRFVECFHRAADSGAWEGLGCVRDFFMKFDQ